MKELSRTDYDHSTIEGNDVDIEISLKEYGLAWIDDKESQTYLVYYGIKMEDNDCGDTDYTRFDFIAVPYNYDIKTEHDWIDWQEVNNYIGMDINDCYLTQQLTDLVNYYGFEEIFGSSYWDGLTYNDIVKEEN